MGLLRSGYDLDLRQYGDGHWRASFYVTGLAHSILGGSAWEPTVWRAVQRAGWDALVSRGGRRLADVPWWARGCSSHCAHLRSTRIRRVQSLSGVQPCYGIGLGNEDVAHEAGGGGESYPNSLRMDHRLWGDDR